MPRPVWFDSSVPGNPDAAAIADRLEACAHGAEGPLRFEPVAVPGGTDMGLLHQAALVRARRQLSLAHSELDRILSQEVRAIDDLVRTANLLVERLREWYSLHAPEATRLVAGSKELANLVAEHGDRDAVMKALDQAKSAATSLGTDLEPGDLAVLQGFAAALSAVHASWTALEARVAQLMEKVAPNVASVVGPVIGARLIALSGGLERLACWPAGTVQLLGAETALFRHIKEGTKPPKHGILFQHPMVHLAAPWSRGAVARALALAAATGAKADAFTKNDLRAHLAEQVKVDMERIAKRKMPARPAYNPRFQKGGGRDGGGFRGPPRRDDRGPPGGFAPRRDDRAPPRQGGFGPRNDDRAPPRQGGFGPRSDDRAPPRQGGFGPRSDDRGTPGGGWRAPQGPRDGYGGTSSGPAKPYRRKPQGAFRSDNKPAAPPGRGPSDGKRKEDP